MYEARITRRHPALFVLLIDRSGSMQEPCRFQGRQTVKAEAVAYVVNVLIGEMLARCRRDDGMRDYFRIALIGYDGDGPATLLGGREETIAPSALVRLPAPVRRLDVERTLPDGRLTMAQIEQPYWIEPGASGDTPMYEALALAGEIVARWCRRRTNAAGYPPVVINVTDGEASDADYHQIGRLCERIRSTGTGDGGTLLMNVHMGPAGIDSAPVLFPQRPEELPDAKYAELLYRASSVLPASYEEAIRAVRGGTGPYRAMSYNCSVDQLLALLAIGSVTLDTVR